MSNIDLKFIRFLRLKSKSVLRTPWLNKNKITNLIYCISTCKQGNTEKADLNETHKKGHPFKSCSTAWHFHTFNDRIFLRKNKLKCIYGNMCLYTTCALSFKCYCFITLYLTSLDPSHIETGVTWENLIKNKK